MKSAAVLVLASGASASQTASPIGKVIEMLDNLEQKVLGEGDAAQKAYEEVAEFCSDRQKEMAFEVETGKSYSGELKATINEAAADIEEHDAKISDLASSSAKSDKELKEATALRKQEAASFDTAEKDLITTIDTLERAGGIISREMNKGSFAQLQGVQGLTSALKTLVEGSSINVADGNKLTALLQSYSKSDDDEEEAGAPGAASYENQSGGIVDLLGDLQSKAEDELSSARDTESKAQHNYDMKAQALGDALKFSKADLDETKKSKAALEEKKAAAEGDLAGTQKDLFGDTSTLNELHRNCQSKAADFEAETATRGEELKALATAKKLIKEATGGASFLQIAEATSAKSAAVKAVVKQVRELAVADKSARLARLASRMEALLQRHGANPFGKVTNMVKDMIAKLEAEAESSASEKAFCDKALAENNEKKDDATAEIEKLSVKMEQGQATGAALKEQVITLQAELASLMKSQQEMDKIRSEENAVFTEAKAEQEKGLTGIQAALKVLRDYYAKAESSSEGAAGGIVSLLEVCESDFSKSLAELNTVEEDAAASYKSETKENELTKVVKDKDVEFKQKEIASLEKAGTELKTDRDAVQDELDSVMASLASLEKQCLAKAESYESKVAKQKAEIDGLKSALESLGGASLLQRNRRLRVTAVQA